MALVGGESASGGEIRDGDGRLIVVGPGGVAIGGGGGASGPVALDAASLAALETVQVGNFPASQPVTGPLTDAQLRASAVPVSGTVTANVGTGTQPVSGTVALDAPSLAALETISVANFPATQPVSLASAVTIGAGAAQIGTVANVGDVDHDAVNTAKVVQMGGHASPVATRPAAVAAGDRVRQWLDLNGAMVISPRKLATYQAVFRAAARPYYLDFTFTAGTRKQYATIHHAATAAKTVRVRRVSVTVILITTAATELNLDLVRITAAPATPNPSITPGIADNADAAAEATCMALPTTAGTEGAVFASQYASLGITGAASTANPPAQFPRYELIPPDQFDDEAKLPTIRAGVLEGWALTIDSTAAARVIARVDMQFSEE